MTKKSNTITQSKKPTNLEGTSDFEKSPWLEDYMSSSSFRLQPITQQAIERLSHDLIEWAKKDDSLRIEDFHWEKDICDGTYSRWRRKYEALDLAHKKAKNYIASRREKGALKKELSETMVMRRQHAYDPSWESDRKREKQDKIDIAIATMKAKEAIENSEKAKVIVLSDLEFKKLEGNQ